MTSRRGRCYTCQARIRLAAAATTQVGQAMGRLGEAAVFSQGSDMSGLRAQYQVSSSWAPVVLRDVKTVWRWPTRSKR